MNPQQNDQQQGNQQANINPQAQNFDGFGGPNIAYANYDDNMVQQQAQAAQQDPGAVPMNVVDVVNANGVVSGRKVVDYLWQRVAICMIVIACGLLIGLVVSLMIVVTKNSEVASLNREKTGLNSELQSIYGKLGVGNLADAVTQIDKTETMDGGDLSEVNDLLTGKFGASYKLDLADANINFVIRNGVYKIVSLGIYRESGTQRVVLYEKIADGKWKLGGFDATKADACMDSTEEEKVAIDGIIPCVEEKEAE